MSQARYIKAVVSNEGKDCFHRGKQAFRLCRRVKMLDPETGKIVQASHVCEGADEKDDWVYIRGEGWKLTREYSLDIKPRDIGEIIQAAHGMGWR